MRHVVLFLLLALPLHAAEPIPVPFITQKPGYCGPAALAMLANYYGQKISQDDIAREIYLPDIHGTLTTDLVAFAQHFNLWVRQYSGSSADLRQKIAASVPLLVLGKFGSQEHYFLVLGIDGFAGTVTVHSDRRANLTMPQEQFWRVWDRADRWSLLVCPPEKATWRLTPAEHNDLGLFLEHADKPGPAAGHYQIAAEQEPKNSYYLMNLGNVLRKQNQLTEAAAAFAQAVKVDSQNADALNNLADVYCEMNANLDEAVALCQRAIKLWPSHQSYYLDTLGSVLSKEGKRQEAITAFEKALATTGDRQTRLRTAIQQRLTKAQALPGN